jgi:hypothetical protein
VDVGIVLLQVRVAATVGEPWDFVTDHGSGPFLGTFIAARPIPSTDRPEFLLRLDAPLTSNGRDWLHFVARPVYRGVTITSIRSGLRTVCALTSVDEEQASSPDPFEGVQYERALNLQADVVVLR